MSRHNTGGLYHQPDKAVTRRDFANNPVRKKRPGKYSIQEKIDKAYLAGLKAAQLGMNRSQPFYKDEVLNQAWLRGNADARKLKEDSTVNFKQMIEREQELLKTNTRSK